MVRRTTVLIADDHAIVSEGLGALLTKHDFEVVGTERDGVVRRRVTPHPFRPGSQIE